MDPKYLVPALDLDLTTEAAKASRVVFSKSPLSSLSVAELAPGAAVPANASDAEWKGYVQAAYQSVHYLRSCSRSPAGAPRHPEQGRIQATIRQPD